MAAKIDPRRLIANLQVRLYLSVLLRRQSYPRLLAEQSELGKGILVFDFRRFPALEVVYTKLQKFLVEVAAAQQHKTV